MRKFIAIIVALVMCFCISTTVFAAKPIRVRVGGEYIKTDVPPEIIEGRTMLPVRAVFEAIGAKVDYETETKTVIATKGDTTVTFVINSNVMTINGEEKEIDVPAMIKNDRTLVPLRACAEAFDLDVEWNSNTKTAIVRKPVSVPVESSGYYDILSLSSIQPIYIKYDHRGNKIYEEDSDGDWIKYTYDENDFLNYK